MDTKPTLWASALAAIGASLCCVGLLVLVSLGLGGAWLTALTQLEPLRPILIVLTLGLLAFAWHTLYRRAAAPAPHFFGRCGALAASVGFPWYAFLFY